MRGLILINTGTPEAPTVPAVRHFLHQFLSDERVLTMHPILRWMLLHLVILRIRPQKSARAYQEIWTPEGSPLLGHGLQLTDKVQALLGKEYVVEFGMRYGQPSTDVAIKRLIARGAQNITALPLFPQFAEASTGSAIHHLVQCVENQNKVLPLHVLPEFFHHDGFIEAVAEIYSENQQTHDADHILFSMHGVPVNHIKASECPNSADGTCRISDAPCPEISTPESQCYRAQCMATARLLAERLNLPPSSWSVSFQSRVGRTPWIAPHTDEVIEQLPSEGCKKLVVICPSFVADCLETIEEMGIRAKNQFLQAGGEEFTLVSCLNSTDSWAAAIVDMVQSAGSHWEDIPPIR